MATMEWGLRYEDSNEVRLSRTNLGQSQFGFSLAPISHNTPLCDYSPLYRTLRDIQEYKTKYLRERLSTVGVSTYAGHDLDCGLDTYHLTYYNLDPFAVQERNVPDYNIYVNVNYKTISYTYFSYTISLVNHVFLPISFVCLLEGLVYKLLYTA